MLSSQKENRKFRLLSGPVTPHVFIFTWSCMVRS